MDIQKINTWTNFFIILYFGMLVTYIFSSNPIVMKKNINSTKKLEKIFKDKNGEKYKFQLDNN
jgi:hypothetical protein